MSEFGTVFVIIPVFNRLHFTRTCLDGLSRQSYPRVVPVVCDGGSSDGTPDIVAREYPNAVVLISKVVVWWAGATAMGIDYAIENGNPDRDFVLFLNNDTEIPEEYIAVLVRIAARRNCAVGAKIVDARNPARCLDAGEYIEWNTYNFPVKTKIAPDELGCDDVDVLPGRGSLVPLSVIRRVGNLAVSEFPHYIADYDFFVRVRKAGIPLFVTYETAVLAHIEETGIMPAEKRLGWQRAQEQLFSRRSMTNVIDHWRFIRKHAPAGARVRNFARLIWRSLDVTPAAIAIAPVRAVCARTRSGITGVVRFLKVASRLLPQIASTPMEVHARRGPELIETWSKDGRLFAIAASMITLLRPPWTISDQARSRSGLTLADIASCGLGARSERRVGWLVVYSLSLKAAVNRAVMPLFVASAWPFPLPRRRARAKLYLLNRGVRAMTTSTQTAVHRGNGDAASSQ